MNYFACLVRFWREGENMPWRVTLEDPHSKDKQNFATPEQYWQYIQSILASSEINYSNQRRIDDQ